MDITDDNDKVEALERLTEEFEDSKSVARDHLHAAKPDLRICINLVADARVTSGSLSGRNLDTVLEKLIEVEGDLSRIEGALVA